MPHMDQTAMNILTASAALAIPAVIEIGKICIMYNLAKRLVEYYAALQDRYQRMRDAERSYWNGEDEQ